MEGLICPACGDLGIRDLPVHEDIEAYPCPVCHPWRDGFPGEYFKVNGEVRWIIKPSAPGEPAEYVGTRSAK